MIPCEVANIASLIDPDWPNIDDDDSKIVIEMAYRVYNAGYRKAVAGLAHSNGDRA